MLRRAYGLCTMLDYFGDALVQDAHRLSGRN